MMIFPIPHQLQLGKQFSANAFDFHFAFQRDQSLDCRIDHLRSPVVRDLEVASTFPVAPAARAPRRVEVPEGADSRRYVETGVRVSLMIPVKKLISFRLGYVVTSGLEGG